MLAARTLKNAGVLRLLTARKRAKSSARSSVGTGVAAHYRKTAVTGNAWRAAMAPNKVNAGYDDRQ